MDMTTFFHEHGLQEQFRELSARDRQLEHWGWFRRHEHRPQEAGWRFQVGEAMIRLGCWLQGRGGAQPARTSGKV
jgi:hypothetical protein